MPSVELFYRKKKVVIYLCPCKLPLHSFPMQPFSNRRKTTSLFYSFMRFFNFLKRRVDKAFRIEFYAEKSQQTKQSSNSCRLSSFDPSIKPFQHGLISHRQTNKHTLTYTQSVSVPASIRKTTNQKKQQNPQLSFKWLTSNSQK